MNQYLLDTNICIYIINRKPEEIYHKFKKIKLENIFISSVTVSELYYGIFKSKQFEKNKSALSNFLSYLNIISFTNEDGILAGEIRKNLETSGKMIGPYDLLIASQSITNRFILVTNNTKEFSRINQIKIENWVR